VKARGSAFLRPGAAGIISRGARNRHGGPFALMLPLAAGAGAHWEQLLSAGGAGGRSWGGGGTCISGWPMLRRASDVRGGSVAGAPRGVGGRRAAPCLVGPDLKCARAAEHPATLRFLLWTLLAGNGAAPPFPVVAVRVCEGGHTAGRSPDTADGDRKCCAGVTPVYTQSGVLPQSFPGTRLQVGTCVGRSEGGGRDRRHARVRVGSAALRSVQGTGTVTAGRTIMRRATSFVLIT
jgi:hypothetical protein